MKALDVTVVVLLLSATAGYVASWALLLFRKRKAGLAFMACGWLISAALFVLNWVVAGEPPFGNMYHVQTFLSLCFLPLFLVLAVRDKLAWTGAYFAFVAALPLLGAFFMDRGVLWRRVPALQSPWFVPHVVAYMIAYALAAAAFTLTVVRFARSRWMQGDVSGYARASYEILRLAFPFMTFGMLSGALWAEEAWGVYWSWDPKETWSLITWTLYVVYFHCRASDRLQHYADVAQVLAFLALLTTFFLVNLLPRLSSVLHSYA